MFVVVVVHIDNQRYNRAVDKIFKSFADTNRRKILTILNKQPQTVNEILGYLNIKQATLSSHLSVLRKARLVTCVIEGKKRIYKLDKQTLNDFIAKLNVFVSIDNLAHKDEIIIRRKIS